MSALAGRIAAFKMVGGGQLWAVHCLVRTPSDSDLHTALFRMVRQKHTAICDICGATTAPNSQFHNRYRKINGLVRNAFGKMADRQGFEPWRRSPAYTLSRRAPSTTRPPVRGRLLARVDACMQARNALRLCQSFSRQDARKSCGSCDPSFRSCQGAGRRSHQYAPHGYPRRAEGRSSRCPHLCGRGGYHLHRAVA